MIRQGKAGGGFRISGGVNERGGKDGGVVLGCLKYLSLSQGLSVAKDQPNLNLAWNRHDDDEKFKKTRNYFSSISW